MRWTISAALAIALVSLTGTEAASAQALASVQGSDLRALDGWQVGQTPVGETALPSTLWRNSDAAPVGALLDKLSAPFASPVATRLARAALFSSGEAPAGSESAAAEAARKRFAALGKFGAADEIAAMSAVSPDPNLIMFAAQADLARGRTSDACRRAQSAATATAFILTVRAFCLASAGQAAAADVALDVARAAGANDPWLTAALPAVSGAPAHGVLARFDTSLNAAISLAGKLRIAPRALAKSSLLALDVVARTSETPALLRAEAAQSALRQYAIEVAAARDAFAPALDEKPTKATPALVAMLHALAAAKDAPAKALAIQAALNRTPTYEDFAAAARLIHDDIAALPRDASTASAAWTMARASLAAGDVKAAIDWREAAVKALPAATVGPQRALDCAIVAAGGGDDAAARAAIEARIAFAGPGAARDAVLLGALGKPIPARAAALIAATPDRKIQKPADPAILADMTTAAQRAAMGETAILAARALAPGAYTLDRASVVSVIQALRAVGLDQFARQVAVEAMIGAGLE